MRDRTPTSTSTIHRGRRRRPVHHRRGAPPGIGWRHDPCRRADRPRPGEGEPLGASVVKAAGPELSLLEFELQPGGEIAPTCTAGRATPSTSSRRGRVSCRRSHGDRDSGDVRPLARGRRPLPPEPEQEACAAPEPARARRFVEYRRELAALRARGDRPDEAFYARHDVFDPEPWTARGLATTTSATRSRPGVRTSHAPRCSGCRA